MLLDNSCAKTLLRVSDTVVATSWRYLRVRLVWPDMGLSVGALFIRQPAHPMWTKEDSSTCRSLLTVARDADQELLLQYTRS